MTAEPTIAARVEPRPGKLLVALSVLLIGGCLLMVGGAVGAMASTFDPCSAISGALMLPVPLFLAVQQYRGVFHRQAVAAFAAACCLVGFGGLFVLAGVGNSLEFFVSNWQTGIDWSNEWPFFGLLATIVLVGLTMVAVGWLTMRWSKQLRAAGQGSVSRTFSSRELAATMALIGVVAGVACLMADRRPSTGINVPPDQAPFSVPPTAKAVCYQMFSGNNGAVEFTTDEATFRQWIAAEVAPAAWDRADVALLEKKAESVIRDYRGKSWLATDVLQYSWSFEGNGAVAIFDPATGRAYYTRYRD